jgi:hypothetical protein
MARMTDPASAADDTTTDKWSESPEWVSVPGRKCHQLQLGDSFLRINGSETRWLLVWDLIFAGAVAAFQIGKAPIAVPLRRHDLGLSGSAWHSKALAGARKLKPPLSPEW